MKRDEERAKLASLTKRSDDASSATVGAAPGGPARRPLDIFVQFVRPDAAGAAECSNTRRHVDPGAKPGALSRRAKPPPVPFLRTISL